MPLRDFFCKNCDTTVEYYYSPAVHPSCKTCGGSVEMTPNLASGRTKTAVFPFVTPHIDADGKPMTITDIGHLRQVERDYGVVLSAFSNEPSNSDAICDLPRYRGDERKRNRDRY